MCIKKIFQCYPKKNWKIVSDFGHKSIYCAAFVKKHKITYHVFTGSTAHIDLFPYVKSTAKHLRFAFNNMDNPEVPKNVCFLSFFFKEINWLNHSIILTSILNRDHKNTYLHQPRII